MPDTVPELTPPPTAEKTGGSERAPDTLWQALLDLLWRLPVRARVALLLLVAGFVAGLAVWATLPDSVKANLLPFGRSTPAAMTDGGQELRTREVTIDFASLDTASAPDHRVAATEYLKQFGIAVQAIAPAASTLVVVGKATEYDGLALPPGRLQNYLTQVNTKNELATFTLRLPEAVESISFTRPALYAATGSGIVYPAWRAYALDSLGREVASESKPLIGSYRDVPAQTFTLSVPGKNEIAAVRFDSDPRDEGVASAAFSAITVEKITWRRRD